MITTNKNNLRFPKLIECGDIYKLDWSHFNFITEQRYYDWKNKHWKATIMKRKDYEHILDSKYMNFLFDAEFVFKDDYLETIKHFANLGNDEWISRPFDTSVREKLLCVAEKSIYNSFYLLSDSISNYNWIDSHIWLSCALSNFWLPQTGRGLNRKRSQIDEIEERTKNIYNFFNSNDIQKMQDFVNMYDIQYKKHSEIYTEISDKEYKQRQRESKLTRIQKDFLI